jgi:secreted PhoX family phosphatase
VNDSLEPRPHYEPDDVVRSECGLGEAFAEVVEQRLSRRSIIQAGLGAVMAGGLASLAAQAEAAPSAARSSLRFKPIRSGIQDRVRVPQGYQAQVVISWGDPLSATTPEFDVNALKKADQERQFGYNNDFLGYHPLPYGSRNSRHGLLSANFEYANPEIMFPGFKVSEATLQQVEVMKAALGMGVVEVKQNEDGVWEPVRESPFNTRYSAETIFEVEGPARGHAWLKTSHSPDGTKIKGTFSNCSAGKTPWGTVLSGEENFQDNFANSKAVTDPSKVACNKRYGIPTGASEYGWEMHDPRFDCGKEENENYHFGWVVEIDPYDPSWTPRKRTSLGRFRHEAATTFVSKGGKVVMYSGCDSRFEYVYKFVCSKPYDRKNRLANRDILNEGTLYVARYNEDGTGEWLAMRAGEGPLTAANGFATQGDVVINARTAGDLLGATKMDRPEDIEVNPVNKKVYVVCTNNTDRAKSGRPGTDKANPRPENRHGHIVEMTEDGDDHGATKFRWELFLVCGDPEDSSTYFAGFDKREVAPISCPDNITFDLDGNLWISTDGQPRSLAIHDGVYAVPVEGPDRGKVMQFMSSVTAAEVCGPEFTPDNKTLFLAIQHPGEGSTFEKPSTSWPAHSGLPRPSVVAITHKRGLRIGK